MALRWYTNVIDCLDPAAQARWWEQALDWQIVHESDDEIALVPGWLTMEQAVATPWIERSPGLVFVRVPERKTVKNRIHIDLAPHLDDDRDAEVDRLISLGATRVDVGQSGDVTWDVLADPEGNEFCVLSSRDM